MSKDYEIVTHLPSYTISKELQAILPPERLRELQGACTEATRQMWDRYAKSQRTKG